MGELLEEKLYGWRKFLFFWGGSMEGRNLQRLETSLEEIFSTCTVQEILSKCGNLRISFLIIENSSVKFYTPIFQSGCN